MVSVGINLPVWGKKINGQINASAHQVGSTESQIQNTQLQLDAQLQQALFLLDDSSRKLALFRDQIIPKATESLNVIASSFQTANATYLDLIQAEKALLEFSLSLHQADANRIKAISAITAVLGQSPFPIEE